MDYNYVESLAVNHNQRAENSKEFIIQEFESYISSLSRNTFIYGYDVSDIKSECYKTLFTCLKLYNFKNHRFVAYAINGIKQHLHYLIRSDNYRSIFEGKKVFSLLDNDEDSLICDDITAKESICNQSDYDFLSKLINNLSEDEKELISFIFYNGNSAKDYSRLKNIPYTTVIYRRDNILRKLHSHFLEVNV